MNRREALRLFAGIVSPPAGAAVPRAPADRGGVAVVYPLVSEPYQSVFTQIIQGIRDAAAGPPLVVRLGADVDVPELEAYLRQRGAMKVIVLGRQAINAASTLNRDFTLVLGGALLTPSPDMKLASAITLAPEAEQLFALLRQLVPETRRIVTVFSLQHSGWMIESAREAARRRGLDLVPIQANDLSAAAREYRYITETVASKRDAMWLLQDPNTVDDSLVLPLLLRSAWDKEVALFSSTLAHVKKGALFALYPDNIGLGRELAALVQQPTPGVLHPARRLKRAVNVRTAAHLGLTLRRADFEAVFPEQ